MFSYTRAAAPCLESAAQANKLATVAMRLLFNTRGMHMKTKFFAAALAAALLGLTGCGTMDRETAGTVGGAVVGGVLGNAVAGTGGAIVGGAPGAVVGNQAAKR